MKINQKQTGLIKFQNQNKKYGFIAISYNKTDVQFNYNSLSRNLDEKNLKKGTKVKFHINYDLKNKTYAQNVSIICDLNTNNNCEFTNTLKIDTNGIDNMSNYKNELNQNKTSKSDKNLVKCNICKISSDISKFPKINLNPKKPICAKCNEDLQIMSNLSCPHYMDISTYKIMKKYNLDEDGLFQYMMQSDKDERDQMFIDHYQQEQFDPHFQCEECEEWGEARDSIQRRKGYNDNEHGYLGDDQDSESEYMDSEDEQNKQDQEDEQDLEYQEDERRSQWSQILYPKNPASELCLVKLEKKKIESNDQFKNQNYVLALKGYENIESSLNKLFENEFNDELIEKGNKLLKDIKLNSLLVQIKLKDQKNGLKTYELLKEQDYDVKVCQRIGLCQNRLNRFADAKRYLNKAYKLDSNDNNIQKELYYNKVYCIEGSILNEKNIDELKSHCTSLKIILDDSKTQSKDLLIDLLFKQLESNKDNDLTTVEKVNQRLINLGISNSTIKSTSKCLRAGILNGYIKLDNGLESIITSQKCNQCSHKLTVRVKDVLYQPDYAGLDQEEGCEQATFKCCTDTHSDATQGQGCDCGAKYYVSQMCTGKQDIDDGKQHNHCHDCPEFGECMGDYRMQHCRHCGQHTFRGLSGLKCEKCKKK